MTLKEEFRDTLEAFIRHCKEQGGAGTFSYDIDSIGHFLANQGKNTQPGD